ncbi:MAG: TIGR03792 family protein [Acidimicrobiia bacterium]|nr:TIGR03792 family protein [Acidimicrobiia bacterium]
MVIELLTFTVSPVDRAQWLEVEERTWSRFLESQDGFVRKEMWVSAADESQVHAVIWWASLAQWKAIGPDAVRAVDDRMGEWFREPTVRTFDVVREC